MTCGVTAHGEVSTHPQMEMEAEMLPAVAQSAQARELGCMAAHECTEAGVER